jgi:hypothetical protein
MARSEQHEMVVVDLEPFDPTATREALGDEGMSDEFREVRSFEDGIDIKTAHAYGDALTFPATLRKERDEAQDMSAIGDMASTRMTLAVEMRDLLVAGIIATTAEVPFKKGDRVKRFKDHQDQVIQEWEDAIAPYVREVRMEGPATYFQTIVLVCESRNAA